LKDAEYDRNGTLRESTVAVEFDPADFWTPIQAAVKDVHGPDAVGWISNVTIRIQMEYKPGQRSKRPKSARAYITVGKAMGPVMSE
jgi:hypothetical protein